MGPHRKTRIPISLVDDHYVVHLLAKSACIDSMERITHYHERTPSFYLQVWRFFTAASESALSRWNYEFTLADRRAVLMKEANYEFMLTRFCNGSVTLPEIPDATGVTGKCKVCRPYHNGCPTSDPGFADGSKTPAPHLMLGSGLNCMLPSACMNATWLSQLEAAFAARAVHLAKTDLYYAHACNMPYVERDASGDVLLYMSYRFGLYLDFLMRQGELQRGERSHVVMEIGAGWGGFAALVKRLLPRTRYIILDIPASLPLQMSYAHQLGYRRIRTLRSETTAGDVAALLRTDFDFLFLLPEQIDLLPDDAVDLTVNLDSMVEMPSSSVVHYLQHVARTSRAFYANNRRGRYNGWRAFRGAVETQLLRHRPRRWQLLTENASWTIPRPPGTPPSHHVMSEHVAMAGKHVQVFVRRVPPALA